MVDNTTAVACINKMGSTKCMFFQLTTDIYQWAKLGNIKLSAAHLPGRLHVTADYESRVSNIDPEWQLNPDVFQRICDRFGVPEIDLFASCINCQLAAYISWKPDPGAIHVDALVSLVFVCFSPF